MISSAQGHHPLHKGHRLALDLELHLPFSFQHLPRHGDVKTMFLPGFHSTKAPSEPEPLEGVPGFPTCPPAPSILIKFQDSPPRSIPAEPYYKTIACQTPSLWVRPGISEILKIAHRLSPATAPQPTATLGPARCPPHARLCADTQGCHIGFSSGWARGRSCRRQKLLVLST